MLFDHKPESASVKQKNVLSQMGIPFSPGISKREAQRLIQDNHERRDNLPPTDGQRAYLSMRNAWNPKMTRGEADKVIARLKWEEHQAADEEEHNETPEPMAGCKPTNPETPPSTSPRPEAQGAPDKGDPDKPSLPSLEVLLAQVLEIMKKKTSEGTE